MLILSGKTMRKWSVVLLVLLLAVAAGGEELPVHMLVPGFTVRELPVKLTNINNVEYMPDGKLLALGYDGRLHLLWDSDGDGLEDKSSVWWQNDANPFRG